MADSLIRVLIVDDHAIVREGLRSFLTASGAIEVIAEAQDGKDGIERFLQLRPDITIMDLRMKGMNGISATEAILRAEPKAKVIVLTTFEGDGYVYAALEVGASAYLVKDAMEDELIDAVKAVHAGRKVLSPSVAATLATSAPRTRLTPRESEVLTLMAKGLQNREIGTALGTTEGTIKTHVKQIFLKLDSSDRTEAVTQAIERGFIEL